MKDVKEDLDYNGLIMENSKHNYKYNGKIILKMLTHLWVENRKKFSESFIGSVTRTVCFEISTLVRSPKISDPYSRKVSWKKS